MAIRRFDMDALCQALLIRSRTHYGRVLSLSWPWFPNRCFYMFVGFERQRRAGDPTCDLLERYNRSASYDGKESGS